MDSKQKLKIVRFDENVLPLVNDGYLSIFFLGSGSAFSKKLYQNNIIITKGDSSIFVDFGTKAPIVLDRLGLNVSNIDNLIITHSHADHVGGVEEIALMNRYFFNKKPNLYITKRYKNILWNETLAGGCKYSEYKKDKTFLSIEDFFNIEYFDNLNFKNKLDNRNFYHKKINGIDIILYQTKHMPSDLPKNADFKLYHLSYGLLIDKKIVFTSDTIFDPDLLFFLEEHYKIEYYFHDCQFFVGGVHAAYDELKTLPDTIKRKMFLMHYGDRFHDYDPEKDGFAGFVKQWYFYNFYL